MAQIFKRKIKKEEKRKKSIIISVDSVNYKICLTSIQGNSKDKDILAFNEETIRIASFVKLNKKAKYRILWIRIWIGKRKKY